MSWVQRQRQWTPRPPPDSRRCKLKRVPPNQILSRTAKWEALREAVTMDVAIQVEEEDDDAHAIDDVG